MTQPTRTVIFEEEAPFSCACAALDVEALRNAFLPLFERAAHAVQVAGYEQDDAVIVRYVVVTRPGSEPCVMRIENFAAQAVLQQELVCNLAEHISGPVDLDELSVTGLRVAAVLERFW